MRYLLRQVWWLPLCFFLLDRHRTVCVCSAFLSETPSQSASLRQPQVQSASISVIPALREMEDDDDDGDDDSSLALSRPTDRAIEISRVMYGQFLRPVVANLMVEGIPDNWNDFWSRKHDGGSFTHAQRLAAAVEELGPTYVKFAQAVSSRPDIVPKSLADALSILQDDMEPFDSATAKEIIRSDLLSKSGSATLFQTNPEKLTEFLQSLSSEPVAAASVGQVFSGYFPGYGKVAVKVKRPGIREIVERDADLLMTVASFIESIPAIPLPGVNKPNEADPLVSPHKSNRLINTELVSSVDEFMSRLFEELDYHKEAANMDKFASLYSVRRGSSEKVKVVVPEVLLDLCTNNLIVMEWIEGTKLTNVVNRDGDHASNHVTDAVIAENLALIELCIDCTLSQLLDTGVLHADPHGGNLLKVKRPEPGEIDPFAVNVTKSKSKGKRNWLKRRIRKLTGSKMIVGNQLPQLGYLDFGMLSTVDSQVQDALVCAIVLLVFARDVEEVARLFGELQLLPPEVVNNPQEIAALRQALDKMFDDILTYPDSEMFSGDGSTQIPELRFDKLLDSLTRLIPRFQFDLPPYFLNNARALSTLEGIAKSLDPNFSVLQVVYPYALNRLLRNPSDSGVVDNTLQSLIRSPTTGRIIRSKVGKLLDDAALVTGFKRRKVLMDILTTRGGLRLARMIAQEGAMDYLFPNHYNRRRKF